MNKEGTHIVSIIFRMKNLWKTDDLISPNISVRKNRVRKQILKWFKGYVTYMHETAMAPNSSTLAWKIPWMEEPGRLQSMRSLRVGHD